MTTPGQVVVGAGALAREIVGSLAAAGVEAASVAPGTPVAADAVAVHVADPATYPMSEVCRAAAVAKSPVAVIVADTRAGAPGEGASHGGPAAVRAAVEQLAAETRVNAIAVVGPEDRAIGAEVAAALVYLTGPLAAPLRGQCLTVDAGLIGPSAGTIPGPAEPEVHRRDLDSDVVAVVGMGLVLPRAASPDEFWNLLHGDRTVIGEPGTRIDLDHVWSADPDEDDHTYSRVSGFMVPHGSPDPDEDFTERWLRSSIAQAMSTVNTSASDRHLFAVGLTVGGSHHLEQSLVVREVRRLLGDRFDAATERRLRDLYPLATESPERMLPYRIARRAAADLPAGTELVVLDAACSSSLYTIDFGARALRAGETDVAVCGGAFALGVQNLVLFSKLRGLSRSGEVRPLDSRADGVLFTDSAAVLVLKTLSRARTDGDTVLGYVTGFGGSSDGKGKAIYAPNPVGQRIALRRAWAAAGVAPADIDWVIAHATGTPTGDRTELSVLGELAGAGASWTVSSNKSVVGHPGWAAGAVSTVHALLALRHESIPAQRHFSDLPAGLGRDVSITVPTRNIPWPAGDRPRTVAISAMGFGGTNGHLLISDTVPDTPPDARNDAAEVTEDPVVVAGWAAHLPGDPDDERVREWLRGGPTSWPTRFPGDYPLPSPVDMRLAPSAIAAMDLSQVIAVRCADALAGGWFSGTGLAERTAVFVGHSGPTTAAVRRDTRAYLAGLAARGGIDRFDDLVAEPARTAVPAATEDSYTGLMPNIIAARIAQRLDLHGPNMSLDAGLDSFTSALVAAIRSLRDGETDLAFVVGVSAAAEQAEPEAGRESAEGAAGVVLTRRSIATSRGLPELAAVRVGRPSPGHEAIGGDRVYHGAEGAFELLRVLHATTGRSVLANQQDDRTPAVVVTVAKQDGRSTSLREGLTRHALELRPAPARPEQPAMPAIPPDCLVVTDKADAFDRKSATVLGLDTDVAHVDALVRASEAQHVRIVLTAGGAFEEALTANDLAFAVIRAMAGPLDAGGSLGVLLLDGFDGEVPRPETGLSTGLLRSVEQELTGCAAFAVITDSADLPAGLAALAAESGHHRYLPVTYLRGGARYELVPVPRPVTEADTEDTVSGVVANPVVLATGGARGITARLVSELLTGRSPQGVWLLGTAPEPDPSALVDLPDKPAALRELMARYPGEKLASLDRRFNESMRAAERARTIRDLRMRFGEDRVHYRRCDVRDGAQVAAVVEEVVDAEGRVDVVVHGAGLLHSTALTRKTLDDYRLVRDVKVRGDHNLRAALATRPPALWCGLSSVVAFVGMPGEGDYQAGNEYLMLSAATSRAAGRDELAILSGLWVESGIASGYATGSSFTSGLAGLTPLIDEQGTELFRAELAGRHDLGGALATTWLGEAEWSTLHRRAPGLRHRSSTRPPVFLTTPPDSDGATTTWRCVLDVVEHPWLLDHLVDERPTVPATVMLQIAAEAATAIIPGSVPVRFSDVVLSAFIRAPRASWPRHLVVTATRDGDVVRVRLSAPPGRVPAREHARMTVHLAAEYAPAPRVAVARPPGIPVPDVYQLGGSLHLQGVFGGLRDARLHEHGGSALFGMSRHATRLDDFTVPSVALDALLRTSVLEGQDSETITAVVPTAISLIDIHAAGNDRDWSNRCGGDVALRYCPAVDSGFDEGVATLPNGTVLARFRGLSSVSKGSVKLDRQTGMMVR
ncbi:SDR family oxidoreductase [Amycolatopsis vastitatis]|uniref:Beta-ketoacyl synthase n=1 Tax=Amycolatopsis vastitatis TaxID=1905142 RepID=A0A229SV07_9PSEU|nr:SDR family oxidoreductase [Amycolatopsis vastitatis]OXM62796.1 hypothetical protein CF165_34060 [Amycolatopsis vastitatis]